MPSLGLVWTRYRANATHVKIQISALASGKARCLGKVLSSGVEAPPVVAESHHDGGELPQLEESF